MAQPAVEIEGLKEFRRDLRAAGPEWPKAIRSRYKAISDEVASRAQVNLSGRGGVYAKGAPKVKGYATAASAAVGVPSGGIGAIAVWGAKKHTGWYAKPRYAGSPPQHPRWVGNGWEPGVAGQGPRGINDAIAASEDFIEREVFAAMDDVAKQAFPDGR